MVLLDVCGEEVVHLSGEFGSSWTRVDDTEIEYISSFDVAQSWS